jgi:hypothetical protein
MPSPEQATAATILDLELTARFGVFRLAEDSCGIRGKAATDSDGRRPSIPIESDHPIRSKATTLLIG